MLPKAPFGAFLKRAGIDSVDNRDLFLTHFHFFDQGPKDRSPGWPIRLVQAGADLLREGFELVESRLEIGLFDFLLGGRCGFRFQLCQALPRRLQAWFELGLVQQPAFVGIDEAFDAGPHLGDQLAQALLRSINGPGRFSAAFVLALQSLWGRRYSTVLHANRDVRRSGSHYVADS